jgi:hypothetical protein
MFYSPVRLSSCPHVQRLPVALCHGRTYAVRILHFLLFILNELHVIIKTRAGHLREKFVVLGSLLEQTEKKRRKKEKKKKY